MNYRKIYEDLIVRGKHRIFNGYTEKHHIIPRCMGGSNDLKNIVKLTPEEHYIAHQLLCKIYPKNDALVLAAAMMIVNRPSNKLYGWIRRRHSQVMSQIQTGDGNSQFGTYWIFDPLTYKSKKISKTESIPDGWEIGRKIKKITQREINQENRIIQSQERKQKKLEFLQSVMYYYRDNDISMRQLTDKFDLGHNVYILFEKYFKDEYHQIVKTKKGNSNVSKGRY
jgi:hypothetical protein